MQRRRFGFMQLMLLTLVVGGAGYYWQHRHHESPQTPKPPAAAVTVQTVSRGDVPVEFEYSARLAGSREVEIRPRVGGILIKRVYTEGHWVKQGDILFQIDPAPFQATLAQAKATFEQAQKDFGRASRLKKERALSPKEFDAAQSSFEQSKAALDTAKINLAYTTVRAPISGYTSEEGFSEGSLVAADSSLLTRLTQLDPMYVEFAYPDTEAMERRRALAAGDITMPANKMLKAEIHLSDGSVYPQLGEIRFTDSIIDLNTGTVRARAVVPNPHHVVLPGQFVRVVVKGFTQKHASQVPEQAIMQSPKGTFVYTVDADNKARIKPVVLGPLNGQTRLIVSGLSEGDRVITEGMIKVKPDAVVSVDSGESKEPAKVATSSNSKS